jgi:putative SOS response-associated peptidase YedK
MSKRIAFFTSKEEVEKLLGLSTDRANLFEPEYNITPGMHIPVLIQQGNERLLERIRWGSEDPGYAFISMQNAITDMKNGTAGRCAVPASGFYVWKDDKEEGSPFLVRLLNSSLLTMAALLYKTSTGQSYFKIIEGPSNVLVQPMSENMPVLLNPQFIDHWMNGDPALPLLENAGKQFLISDLSVMRVSKKVNDPKNNNPKLIQPIPK